MAQRTLPSNTERLAQSNAFQEEGWGMGYKTKNCAKCGEEYQPTSAHQSYCAPCRKAMGPSKQKPEGRHKYYLENKAESQRYGTVYYVEHGEKIRKQTKERLDAGNVWYTEYKRALHCEVCGNDNPTVLEFHHVNPNEKDFNVADRSQHHNKERTMNEILKCRVLCKNCHAMVHAGEIVLGERSEQQKSA